MRTDWIKETGICYCSHCPAADFWLPLLIHRPNSNQHHEILTHWPADCVCDDVTSSLQDEVFLRYFQELRKNKSFDTYTYGIDWHVLAIWESLVGLFEQWYYYSSA